MKIIIWGLLMCGTMGGILGTGGGIPVVSGLVGGTVGDYVKEYEKTVEYLLIRR